MARRKNKRYQKKYKETTIEELYNKFQWFCISYVCVYTLMFILGLISKINNNLLFRWCGIISVFLDFPTSRTDLFIMIFNLHWLIFLLGIIFVLCKLYKLFGI